MDVKEIMRSGELYVETDEEINRERILAKTKSNAYNNSTPLDIEKRNDMILDMLGECELPIFIEPPIRFSYGKHINIGKNFYSNFNLTIVDDAQVHIGENVLIGPNVVITTAGHPENVKKRNAGWQYSKDIIIGDNVWIGAGAIVHPGVKIGNNSIIGSGSIVTKSIPSNVVAYGVPCKVVRKIDDRK